MDPNWIMAIIAIVAVVSPTISTWLNNKYQLKIEKLKLFEKCKYDAIENFTKATEFYYYHRTSSERIINFESSIANLYIYFYFPDYSLFDKLKECINKNDYSKTQFALSEIVRYLSQQANKE